MPLTRKVIELDASGNGSLACGPGFYAGASGCTNVAFDGDTPGTALLTRGSMLAYGGDGIVVQGGTPNGEAVILLFVE